MGDISISGQPARISYGTAQGHYSMIHVVRLVKESGASGWTALPRGLCGARMLVQDGAIQWKNLPPNSATCERCLRLHAAAAVPDRAAAAS